MKRLSLTAIAALFAMALNAQITKQQADSIVIGIVMNDTTKVAYGMNTAITRTQSIITADGIKVNNPYDYSYVYYIDDMPEANWAHPCRYCFVNVANGVFYTENQMFYPENYDSFIMVGNESVVNNFHWPYTNYTVPEKVTPNGKLYAVLIGGPPGDHFPLKTWYNLSCVYTTLVNKYGFKEKTSTEPNHIIVTAYSSIMNYIDQNDLTNDLYDLNQSGGVYDRYDFFEDIEYSKDGIHEIFNNLAGTINTTDQVPELTEEDQLFIMLCGHGNRENGNSYFRADSWGVKLYDYELAEWVRNIKCSQMVFLIDCCYSGGFIDDIMNDSLALCKNRSVHTTTDATHEGFVEQHITRRDRPIQKWHRVDEYVYYWTAASLGYYPILEICSDSLLGPWHQYDNTTIGYFPWYLFPSFHEGDVYSHAGYDVTPDRNANGIVSMEEAFIFANNLDSYSPQGYFNPYGVYSSCIEYPQSSYESVFTKELLTLDGYKGHIGNDAQTSEGHTYILDGNVVVGRGKSLTIKNNTVINGYGHVFTNFGGITTAANITSATFDSVGIVNAAGDLLELSNCTFNNCGTIISYDGQFSITNSVFNETALEITTNNPGRDIYNIDIIGNDFNISTNINAIYLRKQLQCNVIGNDITSRGNGIYAYRLSGTYNNNRISNNNIHNCGGSGIVSYNSNLKLEGNSITQNNEGGLKSLNISNIYAMGDSTTMMLSQTQSFIQNGLYQVFASSGSSPIQFHFNALRGRGTSNDTILYFESCLSGSGKNSFDVKHNAWYPITDSQVPSHLYTDGIDTYNYLPSWNLGFVNIGHDEPGRMLAIGDSLASNGDYNEARAIYTNIISLYSNTEEAVASLKSLYAIENDSHGPFEMLKTYYLGLVSDEYLGNVADKLVNNCDVAMKNYSNAITWYENKLTDPQTSYSDRIFAEIDLGDLYLDMDTVGVKEGKGTMAEYIPVSKESHKNRSEYLLSLLPENVKYHTQKVDRHPRINYHNLQLTCNPNPVNNKMTISFTIDSDSEVDIKMFNMFGNEVKHINLQRLGFGYHEKVIDLLDLPAGLYFCNITTSNGQYDIVKIIVEH